MMRIKGGEVVFDVQSFVRALPEEIHKELSRYLISDEKLFANVLECVASDSSLGSYNTDDEEGEWWFSAKSTLELREKLIPLMPAIARHAVEQALYQRNYANAECERMSKWAWDMFRAWPRGCSAGHHSEPAIPDFARPYFDAKQAEVDALMNGGDP